MFFGLAYLLARASDTIADTDAIPKEQRLEMLHAFRQRFLNPAAPPLNLETIAGCQSSPGERALLARLSEALARLSTFEPSDQERIRAVLEIITSAATHALLPQRASCSSSADSSCGV